MAGQSNSDSSPPTAARHVCPDCGRSYKAVETLNRHRKNHSDFAEHECDVCDASFKRKDLLDRHAHIHSSGHAGAITQRSQRACLRCSRLKTRCDNSNPCSRCVRGGHECSYRDVASHGRVQKTTSSLRGRSLSTTADDANPTPESQPFYSLDAMSTYLTPDPAIDWPMDATWLESLPQIPPLNFADGSGALAARNANTGMLWDFATTTSPADLPPAPTLSKDPYLGLDASAAQWPQYPYAQPPHLPDSGTASMELDHMPVPRDGVSHMTNGLTGLSVHNDKALLVADMIRFAVEQSPSHTSPQERATFWQFAAHRATTAFGISGSKPASGHVLRQFVDIFFEKFDAKFPLLWQQGMNLDAAPPYLYLVMCAIGAAFEDTAAVEFYNHIIDAIRGKLVLAAFQVELSDDEGFTMCQTLTLLQASMLFFATQKRNFAFPQQVGVATVSLARRINLFNEGGPHHVERYLEDSSPDATDSKKTWVELQLRRRLALAILRLEVFMSILVGSRPLVSFEEINLHIPTSDTVWLKADAANEHLRNDPRAGDDEVYLLSDLVRIALDKEEPLPGNLQPHHLEAILHGLQHYVWRFSQDHNLGRRLDVSFDEDESEGSRNAAREGRDLLDFSRRGMRDLKNDYRRTITALKKWKAALTSSARTDHLHIERRSLLASYLLYNVSFMRLKADLAALHRLALRCIRDEQLPADKLAATHDWAWSRRGKTALEHACSTWLMITQELRRPRGSRAEFNTLSSVALLHAAVVVWAFAGEHPEPGDVSLDPPAGAGLGPGPAPELRLCRANNFALMQSFAKLLKEVQPMRPGVKTSAYHHTVATLAYRPIPLMGSAA